MEIAVRYHRIPSEDREATLIVDGSRYVGPTRALPKGYSVKTRVPLRPLLMRFETTFFDYMATPKGSIPTRVDGCRIGGWFEPVKDGHYQLSYDFWGNERCASHCRRIDGPEPDRCPLNRRPPGRGAAAE